MAVPNTSPVRGPHAVSSMATAPSIPGCPLCAKRMVVRRLRSGPSAGLTFWGCSAYPDCLGVRPLGSALAGAPADISARITYERRLARHRAKVRLRRTRVVLLGGSAVVGGIVVGLLGPTIHRTLGFFGWSVAAAAAIWAIGELWSVPAEIKAWRTGALGEERTAKALADLEAEGFVVLHDRRKPGSRENIDHVIVGPTGVFVVETKSYSGPLSVQGDDVYVGGRRRTDIVHQAKTEAEVVRAILEIAGEKLPVTPILCVHRAELPLLKAEVQGIRVVNERGLVRLLRRPMQPLDPKTVRQIADLLNRELRPAL
jgi:Nuclease-related domain/Topoisomerase DNA binding C4 zinc finger